jgi:exodeoxyribonuclease VII large subunit
MKVNIFGAVTVYERQGRYQIDVHQMLPAGIGELQMAFEALKQRLHAEGLFEPEHKKSLPEYPERIGIITSPTGAAVRDIVSVIERRFPAVQLILWPVSVQGEGAAAEIAGGIRAFNEYGHVDVLIVGRGGGSLEDLWAFNEEIVARAIFESEIPVVSAVGHEIDFSISDFVADVRAPTPSAAAEIVVNNQDELRQWILQMARRMAAALIRRIEMYQERINALKKSYGFRAPMDWIKERRLRIDDMTRNLETSRSHRIEVLKTNMHRLKGKLETLNPKAVLERGYSITTRISDGLILTRAADTQKDERVRIRLAHGAVCSVIEDVEEV